MRKIALLTLPLLVLGLFSLSADENVSFDLSGNTTFKFGVDLGTNASGMTNASETSLKITLVPKQGTDTGMMDTDDIYAWVELKDFQYVINGDQAAPAITTKLFMGPFSITTFSAPTVKVDYVEIEGGARTLYEGSGGLTLSYQIDPVELSLGVISMKDWEDTNADAVVDVPGTIYTDEAADAVVDPDGVGDAARNLDSAYAFIGTVGVDVGDTTDLEIAVAYAHEYGDDTNVGVGAKATFDLGNIDPSLSFDGAIPAGGAAVPWDVGAGVKWNLSADEESSFSADLTMSIPADESEPTVGTKLSLTEGTGDEGAVAGLGATLSVALNDITDGDNTTWDVSVDASYLVEGIKPFFMIGLGSGADAAMPFKAGLEISAIEKVTTTLQYETSDLDGDDSGAVTAAIKISF